MRTAANVPLKILETCSNLTPTPRRSRRAVVRSAPVRGRHRGGSSASPRRRCSALPLVPGAAPSPSARQPRGQRTLGSSSRSAPRSSASIRSTRAGGLAAPARPPASRRQLAPRRARVARAELHSPAATRGSRSSGSPSGSAQLYDHGGTSTLDVLLRRDVAHRCPEPARQPRPRHLARPQSSSSSAPPSFELQTKHTARRPRAGG